MIYGSVCSGIEAATAAWHPLGWKASFFSEIEKFPRQVLAHHYPDTPLHGDFTTIQKGDYEPIELLVGGTPCQSFSVAGLRAGLNDPRGNLMLEFGALAQRLQPRWLVWENVPGVLSSNGGRDFGSFLAMLGELGYGFSYRVLDAQFFGVAQRRRRVFVIGHIGSWQRAAAVLFERDSLQGNLAPSRETGKEVAGTITAGAFSGGAGGRPEGAASGHFQPVKTHRMVAFGEYSDDETASALKQRDYKDATDLVTYGIPGNWINRKPENGGNAVEPMHNVAPCLTKTDQHAVVFNAQGSSKQGDSVSKHITPTLDKSKIPAVMQSMQVRRLTPKECERLQGFPEIKKEVRICIDHQKNYANAENKNHKLQSAVSNVEKKELNETALCAEVNLNAKNQQSKSLVVVDALINLEQSILQIHSQGKLVLSVNLAEKKSLFRQFMQLEDIARLLVQQMKKLEAKATHGKVESQQNINHSLHQESGSLFVNLSGQEIEELAKDAELFTKKVSEYMKFITLEVGLNSKNCEKNLVTLCYFVMAAINSFIQEQTQTTSLLEINLSITHGFTNIPGASDSARYKALGNSMAVPCMAWLGSRIQLVEDLCISAKSV